MRPPASYRSPQPGRPGMSHPGLARVYYRSMGEGCFHTVVPDTPAASRHGRNRKWSRRDSNPRFRWRSGRAFYTRSFQFGPEVIRRWPRIIRSLYERLIIGRWSCSFAALRSHMFRVAVSRCALAVYLMGYYRSFSPRGSVGGCGCCGRPGLFRGAVPLAVNSSGAPGGLGVVEIERGSPPYT